MDILKNDEGKEMFETVECYSSESFVTETDINEHVAFDMELHSISIICDLYDIPLLSLKKISDNLSLGDYYENLTQNEVFELTSFLDYKIDGVSLLCKMHNL